MSHRRKHWPGADSPVTLDMLGGQLVSISSRQVQLCTTGMPCCLRSSPLLSIEPALDVASALVLSRSGNHVLRLASSWLYCLVGCLHACSNKLTEAPDRLGVLQNYAAEAESCGSKSLLQLLHLA